MKRKINLRIFILITTLIVLSCKEERTINQFKNKINPKEWRESTIDFFKANCGNINTKTISNNSYVSKEDSIPLIIQNKHVKTISDQIKLMILSRNEIIDSVLGSDIIIYDNKLYISDFYQYNQPKPHFIIYSKIEEPFLVEYSEKKKKYIINNFEGSFQGFAVDLSIEAKNIKCNKNLTGNLTDVEIFTEIIFTEEKTKYLTKYMYLGN